MKKAPLIGRHFFHCLYFRKRETGNQETCPPYYTTKGRTSQMIDPEENHMVTGVGYYDREAAARREARAEAEWEHADDQYNDELDFEYEEEMKWKE